MSEARFNVVGIGNAIVDIITRCEDQFLHDQNLSKGHMQLIETSDIERLYGAIGPAIEISGGSAANTCAGIASFGGDTAFIGKISDDEFGRIFAHDLNAIGVNYTTEKATGGLPTARSLVLVTPDGERTMNTYLGVSPELDNSDIDAKIIEDAKVTYLEGYLFDRDEAKAAFHQASRIASAAGRKVALSLSDAFCVDRHRAEFQQLIKSSVDILFANEDEICALYETQSFDDACTHAKSDCTLAALTRGSKGSLIISGDEMVEIAAHPVAEVIDTTGAGDLYAAGFLFGYTGELGLQKSGQLGSLAAAEIISHLGARPETSLATLARNADIA